MQTELDTLLAVLHYTDAMNTHTQENTRTRAYPRANIRKSEHTSTRTHTYTQRSDTRARAHAHTHGKHAQISTKQTETL